MRALGIPLGVPSQSGTQEKHRSLLYDIWAMGCITLVFITWLLYGLDELKVIYSQVRCEISGNSPFYQFRVKNGKRVASIHHVVTQWIDHIAKGPTYRVGATALGDLLNLVRTRFVVVKPPRRLATLSDLSTMDMQPRTGRASTALIPPHNRPERALTKGFRDHMLLIAGEDEEESYWFTDVCRPSLYQGRRDSSYTAAQGNSQYQTEGTAENTHETTSMLTVQCLLPPPGCT